jgi:hypothetical protein
MHMDMEEVEIELASAAQHARKDAQPHLSVVLITTLEALLTLRGFLFRILHLSGDDAAAIDRCRIDSTTAERLSL